MTAEPLKCSRFGRTKPTPFPRPVGAIIMAWGNRSGVAETNAPRFEGLVSFANRKPLALSGAVILLRRISARDWKWASSYSVSDPRWTDVSPMTAKTTAGTSVMSQAACKVAGLEPTRACEYSRSQGRMRSSDAGLCP